jgi:hypothetical protein
LKIGPTEFYVMMIGAVGGNRFSEDRLCQTHANTQSCAVLTSSVARADSPSAYRLQRGLLDSERDSKESSMQILVLSRSIREAWMSDVA